MFVTLLSIFFDELSDLRFDMLYMLHNCIHLVLCHLLLYTVTCTFVSKIWERITKVNIDFKCGAYLELGGVQHFETFCCRV